MKRLLLAFGAAFCGFLSACADGRISGNSTETESGIDTRLLSVTSILPEWNHPQEEGTVVTLRFDRKSFDFSRAAANGRGIWAERLDSTLLPFEIVYWDSAAAIGRMHVRLDTALLRNDSAIRIRWSTVSSTALGNSQWTWDKISDAQKLDLNSVLVDDFESGSGITELTTHPAWTTGSSDSAKILSLSYDSARMGRLGKALHLSYTMSGAHFVVVKTPLIRGDETPRSLRSLDSIVFWARGGGTFFVAFEHLTNDSGPKSWTSRTVDSNWTRFVIRPKDLDTVDKSSWSTWNRGWNAVRDSVTHLTFIAGVGKELWLDDIRLYGIDRGDLR
jgi:hypothetical protein